MQLKIAISIVDTYYSQVIFFSQKKWGSKNEYLNVIIKPYFSGTNC
jgi:hypothetical protein